MKFIILRLLVFTVFPIITALAQKSAVFAPEGKAIKGYDPVAYFTDSKPIMGDQKLVYRYQGADWYFANEKNRDAFRADPKKYEPQYGGYCAYGTADGHKAPTEADAWTIQDGKLYLNYNRKVQTMWNKDRPGYIKKADTNWPILKDKESN